MTKWLLMLLLMTQYTLPVHLTTAGVRAIPLNPCLISGWPMNEGSGFVFNDVSGNGNTVNMPSILPFTWQTNTGFPGITPLWSAAAHGTAGADSTNASLTNFDGTTPFTVSTWMQASATSQQALVSTISSVVNNYRGWELLTGFPTSAMRFYVGNSNGSNALIVHGSTNVLDGSKHFLVATYDGSRTPSGVHLYVDGSTQTQTTEENDLTATAAQGNAVALAQRFDGTEWYNGVQADTAIYNCVLTPTEVTLYNSNGPGIY
jgi:hypothetical protein